MGRVALVGAGPGDPELLTVKALHLIRQAEVVVYDRLVGPEILSLIPLGVRRIDMGKRCGAVSPSQTSINACLIRLARRYERVVRLKGGDPLIFGRGGEEALALRAVGIEVMLVPGITAAIGCAAASGIPLTHRGLSRSVTLLTGHLQSGSATIELGHYAPLLAHGHTLVFYMGLEQAQVIAQGLLMAGVSPALPMALIGRGTLSDQVVETTTLQSLVQVAHRWQGMTPVLMVAGAVVTLHGQLLNEVPSLWEAVA